MGNTKVVNKFWFGWDSEKIEAWLEQQAAEGWLLQKVGGQMTVFHFLHGEPAKMRCAVDYQDKDTPDYRQLLQDAGWSLVATYSGWFLWQQRYEIDRPQIYSDLDSLIRRNQRVLNALTASFAAQIPLFVVILTTMENHSVAAGVLLALWAVLFAIVIGCVIGMARSIAKLKKRKVGMPS